MKRDATKNSVHFMRIGIDATVSSENEDSDVEFVLFEKLCRSASGVAEGDVLKKKQDVSLVNEALCSVMKMRKDFAVNSAASDHFGLHNDDLLSKLRGCQREMRAQRVAEMNLYTLTNHVRTSTK